MPRRVVPWRFSQSASAESKLFRDNRARAGPVCRAVSERWCTRSGWARGPDRSRVRVERCNRTSLQQAYMANCPGPFDVQPTVAEDVAALLC